MRKRIVKNLLFYGATILLVLVTAFCVTGTVISQSNIGEKEKEAFYQEKEKQLVKEIRDFLKKEGYADSGVMLTRVVDAEGNRSYTMTIHHARIDRMEPQERECLERELVSLGFASEGCTFSCKFA